MIELYSRIFILIFITVEYLYSFYKRVWKQKQDIDWKSVTDFYCYLSSAEFFILQISIIGALENFGAD